MKLRDLTGKTFGKWTVIERSPSAASHTMWLCRCACGNVASVGGGNLRRGGSSQCDICAGHHLISLAGQRFGRWIVMEKAGTRRGKSHWTVLWKCRCDCGEVRLVTSGNLRRGTSTQCNLCARGYVDLTGKRFGSWTVIERVALSKRPKGSYPTWRCVCVCGREGVHASSNLTRGDTRQCQECARKEKPSLRLRPFEALFNIARKRARDERHEWILSYEEFVLLAERDRCHYCGMTLFFARHCVNKTGSKYNLDRKDNNLGYIPGNVVVCCKRCNHAKGARFTYDEWYGMTAYLRNQQPLSLHA